MNTKVIILFLGVVAMAAADRLPAYSYNAPQESREYSVEESEPAKYDFAWAVKDDYSGNDFNHQESRDGDNTQGSYTVQLPDGRLQTVTYYVDGDSGYVAEVSYQGEAQYPDSDEVGRYQAPSAPAPRYSAPAPAPAPRYSAPESEESAEAPVYTPPRPSYSPPRRAYGFPQ